MPSHVCPQYRYIFVLQANCNLSFFLWQIFYSNLLDHHFTYKLHLLISKSRAYYFKNHSNPALFKQYLTTLGLQTLQILPRNHVRRVLLPILWKWRTLVQPNSRVWIPLVLNFNDRHFYYFGVFNSLFWNAININEQLSF